MVLQALSDLYSHSYKSRCVTIRSRLLRAPSGSSLLVLYGPQGNSLGLLYALANKFAVFSQVYSTTGKQVSPPSSPSAALANFLYQPTLCLMQNFSPITYPSKGIRWLLCECELVTILAVCTILIEIYGQL